MAGRGTRTSERYSAPKPIIPLHGHPLLAWALAGLPLNLANRVVFVTSKSVADQVDLTFLVKKYLPSNLSVSVEILEQSTSGQAETVFLGTRNLPPDESILIFNCDTLVSNNFPQDYSNWDGLLGTFKSMDPGMSYVESIENRVTRTAEKQVISEHASTGLYYFKQLSHFDSAFLSTKHLKESYVAPIYNALIEQGFKIGHFHTEAVLPLGTSEEIHWFESLPIL